MRSSREEGYSLPALIATATIMLILMAAAVPSWRYVMKDAREEELLFRGIQIAEAIERYQKKNGNAPPLSIELLVQGKYLRKPYTDPMTKTGKWRFIRMGEPLTPGPQGARPSPSPSTAFPQPAPGGGPGATLGGIVGVASTSQEKSLRMFNGRTKYSDWLFVAGQPRVVGKPQGPVPAPGTGPGGRPGPSPTQGGRK